MGRVPAKAALRRLTYGAECLGVSTRTKGIEEETSMARKMEMGQPLIWLGVTLLVCYLNTLFVWLWPDLSLWAFGVVLVLSVVSSLTFTVLHETRRQRTARSMRGEQQEVFISCEG